jgi:hypothetical protein
VSSRAQVAGQAATHNRADRPTDTSKRIAGTQQSGAARAICPHRSGTPIHSSPRGRTDLVVPAWIRAGAGSVQRDRLIGVCRGGHHRAVPRMHHELTTRMESAQPTGRVLLRGKRYRGDSTRPARALEASPALPRQPPSWGSSTCGGAHQAIIAAALKHSAALAWATRGSMTKPDPCASVSGKSRPW